MPRAPIITPDAVARAAAELLAQGKPATNAAVLELVGGGSMSTLAPLLRAWREAQKDRMAREDIEVPEPIMDQARDLATRIWRDATQEANTAADALRKELRDQQEWAEQQLAELLEHLGKVEAERDALSARCDDLEAAKVGAAAELNELRAAGESLREKCTLFEAASVQADERAVRAEERADRAEERLVSFLNDMKAAAISGRTGEVEKSGSGSEVQL